MSKFSTIALIVAAGSGSRFGIETPKQYAFLGGKPLLLHSLETLLKHPKIDAVAVVINPSHREFYDLIAPAPATASAMSLSPSGTKGRDLLAAQLTTSHKPLATLLPPIHGGKERQDSVRLGLKAIAQYSPTKVLVHDAARPALSAELLDRLLECNDAAVVPALPMVDTVRDKKGNTLDRNDLYRVQTPQCFDYQKLVELHENTRINVTDDAGLFEAAGLPVTTVMGDSKNEKVTTLEDWERMQKIYESSLEVRVGSGYDVHAFASNQQPATNNLTLCGVSIPHSRTLEGHSDADVGLHALVDALLGAASEGDIGVHFPPSNAKWKGADSAQFVTYTRDLIKAKGGVISHVDITLICEKPKITPHRETMRARIAELLELDIARVSVKATTTEKLGFTGREEGIAAQAIATIKLPV